MRMLRLLMLMLPLKRTAIIS